MERCMASGDGEDRTEQPTSKRREEAREKGQVAKSPDVTAALGLLGALGAFAMMGTQLVAGALALVRRGLGAAGTPNLSADDAFALLGGSLVDAARMTWPFIAVPAVVGIASQLLQTRFAFSTAALKPDWSRVSPAKGLGRLFGLRSVAELVKAILKLGVIGGVAYYTLRGDWPLLLPLGQGGPEAALGTVAHVVWRLWLGVGVSYLIVAGMDYGYQWWEHERSMRMTKEEIREESKQTDGNPQLRARLRAIHKQMASRRLPIEVKKAHVVVRNPTHFAVALRYEGGSMRAPRVVAKGADLVAQRIIDIAKRERVPVVENRTLARALYKLVKVGADVPPSLYRAVAEVLAYVYSLRGRGR
jgi:flagellar biosynthetic protein FlhB